MRLRLIHIIPAFLFAIAAGGLAAGILAGTATLLVEQDAAGAIAVLAAYALFSLLYAPVVALIFFPLVFILRQFALIGPKVMTVSGAVVGLGLWFLSADSMQLQPMAGVLFAFAGLVGGTSAHRVIRHFHGVDLRQSGES